MLKRLLLLIVLGLSMLPAHTQAACTFVNGPVVINEEGDRHSQGSRLLQVWEVPNNPVFWSETVPATGGYRAFRQELAALDTETDPVLLLERSPTENNLIVMRNADEWIAPAGCLEMLLIGYQHERLNTFESPTEFASVILRSADKRHLRVYYYTINEDGIGRMTPIVDPVLRDRQDGWQALVVLHSHVFHPGQPEIDGIPAPSIPDADFHAKFYAQSGVREAWITNGVSTVRMPASSFNSFQRQPESQEEDRASK